MIIAPNTKPLKRRKTTTQNSQCSAAELPPVTYVTFYQCKPHTFGGAVVRKYPKEVKNIVS